MPTFGFSAYLKLICLNEKQQKSELKKRLFPTGSGYYFHRNCRLLAKRLLNDGESLEIIFESVEMIQKEAEREQTKGAILALYEWRSAHPGRLFHFEPAVCASPSGEFKILFEPTFGIELEGVPTAVHIWNTKKPALESRFVYGALSLLAPVYASVSNGPSDLAVLSLRDGNIYQLGKAADHSMIGTTQVGEIERALVELRREKDGSPVSPHRPSTPPPPP